MRSPATPEITAGKASEKHSNDERVQDHSHLLVSPRTSTHEASFDLILSILLDDLRDDCVV